MYYQTEPYGVTSQYYIPVGENIVNPRVAYSYPGNIYERGSNKRFTPIDAVDIAHYQDNTGNNQMTYIGNIGDVATALNEVEKQGKRNLTHLFNFTTNATIIRRTRITTNGTKRRSFFS